MCIRYEIYTVRTLLFYCHFQDMAVMVDTVVAIIMADHMADMVV